MLLRHSSDIPSRPLGLCLCLPQRPLVAEESIGMKENLIRTMALPHTKAKDIVLITNARMAFEGIWRTREQDVKQMMIDTMLALRYRRRKASCPRLG